MTKRIDRGSVWLIWVCALALLSACTTGVQKVPLAALIPAPGDAATKIVQFRKAPDAITKGDPVGKSRFGVLCITGKPFMWRDGRINANDDELSESFREQVEKAKFATVVDSVASTQANATALRAGFVVTAQLISVYVDACAPWSDFGNWLDARGGAYVKVQWQIYSASQSKIIQNISTEGSYQTSESISGGASELVRNAFSAATRNLMADPMFFRTIHGDKGGQSGSSTRPLAAAQKLGESVQTSAAAEDPASAFLTVIAGERTGNGFAIVGDGYLITSAQTVRGYNLVKLRTSGGHESLGFVLRLDEQSGVAVVKLTDRTIPALEVRSMPAPIAGEDVYVMNAFPANDSGGLRRGKVVSQKAGGSPPYVPTNVPLSLADVGIPVFDKAGKVVGVASMGESTNQQPKQGGFVPMSVVMSRLALTPN